VLTAFLIWWERDDLAAIHVDRLAVALIVFFKPAQTVMLSYWGIDTSLTFPHPASLFIWLVALLLAVSLELAAPSHAPVGWRTATWVTSGLLAGLALSALANLDAFRNTQELVPLSAVSASTGLAFFYQMGFAAVSEEPLFRGFLWGYVRRLGWNDAGVWLSQALLFMLAHLYFINALHIQFWLIVPAGGLILGLFAWRSRSIAPGMLAHAAYNSGAYVVILNALAVALRLR